MKKIATLCLFSIAWLVACRKDDAPSIRPIDLTVELSFDADNKDYGFPVENIEVALTNTNGGAPIYANTDASGAALFPQVNAGLYNISAVFKVSPAAYLAKTGVSVKDSVVFNAVGNNINIYAATNISKVQLSLVPGKVGDWVIKQVYYAGSDLKDGASFRDQFIEVYNNSNDTLYADSLYISRLWGLQTPSSGYKYYLVNDANGQFDWTKSLNMPTGIDANKDYVYMRDLFMIPGNGTTYPVAPGKGLLIASTGINHKQPFTDDNGKDYSVNKPELTVDLSQADFEAYLGDAVIANGGNKAAYDLDNPGVTNLRVVKYDATEWILDNLGRDSYVIFKMPGGEDAGKLPAYNDPSITPPTATSKVRIQLPVAYIIDGVEVMPNDVSDLIPKKLQASLDAGYTYAPAGKYSSQSVIRKTAKTVNGRTILQDTNNSTVDFDYFEVATPLGFK